MSTSLLVKKMLVEAEKRGLAAEIKAFGASEFDDQMPHYGGLAGTADQVHATGVASQGAAHGIKVQPIDMMDYGMQRGDKVLDYALSLIG
jgi:PTS system cellobiose-specific IIB component